MLWRDLKTWQVFGANTNVGKTIVSTLLCRALQNQSKTRVPVLYLKPVSTGPQNEADIGHISAFVPGAISKNISQFSRPLSPHLAARIDQDTSVPRADSSILSRVKAILADQASAGGQYAIVETAGGVLSPGPSGTVQADLYRPLRLPTILVGDSKLGGIATTISAFESLHIRGYDVESVVLFRDHEWGNSEYLDEYFQKYGIPTFALPRPPQRHENAIEDKNQLQRYYTDTSEAQSVSEFIGHLNDSHIERVRHLISMPETADEVIWHPFRQHGIPYNLTAIDSAYDDHFQTYSGRSVPFAETTKELKLDVPDILPPRMPLEPTNPLPNSLLTPQFDASASWWTQGLGHGNVDLALTAAHAAGRYGHVMFAHAVHQPALDISANLLLTLRNERLEKVFFTDNGSTGMEVAVKMALRASSLRRGWRKDSSAGQRPVEVLGLKGSYHGDTIGVMNCSEPSVFNEKVDWHQPWGHWFDPPSLLFTKGRWELTIPAETSLSGSPETQYFSSFHEISDFDRRRADANRYTENITRTLQTLVHEQQRRFGALILEPLLMGAGGMILVDPLFQRTLIKTIRENPSLLVPSDTADREPYDFELEARNVYSADWSGVPIIADEVFTGLYRLGRASSSSFLGTSSDWSLDASIEYPDRWRLDEEQEAYTRMGWDLPTQPRIHVSIAPDISVHAKLLTGGLLPLAITAASQSIFDTFLSQDKTDALLHGHSYTAHPVGCMVADKALEEYRKLDKADPDSSTSSSSNTNQPHSWTSFKRAWGYNQPQGPTHTDREPGTMHSQESTREPTPESHPPLYSFFPPTLLTTLSHHPRVRGCFALGTVLVLKMAPTPSSTSNSASGYTSTATSSLQARLLTLLDEEGAGIHSRVLGDVIYFMASLTTKEEQIERLGRIILRALDLEMEEGK
ncbi:hypothetical protein H2200_010380 [Cladophialophora chaetospira]|uniref:Dethiobiotin synthase n=1 Tax=Cladophialophora chaetospira TaxID=386627 RepID=A0AA38X1D3_9EURO|nr:hypothetical protein H2200_010380 [Cladophialophora chaetospira]